MCRSRCRSRAVSARRSRPASLVDRAALWLVPVSCACDLSCVAIILAVSRAAGDCAVRDTCEAAAASSGGALRRTQAGCDGTPLQWPRHRSDGTSPQMSRPRPQGRRARLRPRARIAAQKSTSSAYMKYRSSNSPTASASARRTSKHARSPSRPRGPARQTLHVTAYNRRPPVVAADEQFLAQLGKRADHRAERQLGTPLSVDQSWTGHRGCGRRLEDLQQARQSLPEEALYLGSAGARAPPDDRRMPMLFARENPTFAPASMTVTPGQRCRTAWAVPSAEPLSTTSVSLSIGGIVEATDARQASMCPIEL